MNAAPRPEPDPAADRAVEEIVFRCLESEDAERELQRAGAEHPELVPRARAMLDILQRQGLLEARSSTGIPDRLGRYVLGRRLGEGGMGVVFAARDTGSGRIVAVKILRPDMLPFANSRHRFDREIAALSRLQHAGIARVLDSGEDRGVRYYAMELVEGESLARILERLRPRSLAGLTGRDLFPSALEPVDGATSERTLLLSASWVEACARIVRDVATALAYVHDQGLLHRDVKPGNVMLGADGRSRLLDFGLARADDAQTMTRTGAVIGSLPYMAPEQVLGERARVDARSDVYALGVVLYELLTLRSPFTVAEDPEATRRRILRGRAPCAGKLNPGVGRDLEAVCAKAMARDPELRHETAGQLAGELDAVLARGDVRAATRMRRLVQRHPAWGVRLGAAAVLGLAGLGAWLVHSLGEAADLMAQRVRLEEAVAETSALARTARWLGYRGALAAAQSELSELHPSRARELLDEAPQEHRAWEWRYLRRRAAAPQPRWSLPSKTLGSWFRTHLAADGEHLVLGLGANTVAVCRRADGRIVRSWRLPGSQFKRGFSADGRVYTWLSRPDLHRLRWFELDTGKRGEFDAGEDLASCGLSEDGRLALLRLRSRAALVVDRSSGRVLRRFSGESPTWVSPDGALVAVLGENGLEFEVSELGSGRTRWRGTSQLGPISPLIFLRGSSCVLGFSAERVQTWRLRDGRPLATLHLGGSYRFLAGDPDAEHVWTTHGSGTLRCWSLVLGRCVLELHGYPKRSTKPAFDVERQRMLLGETHGKQRFYELDLVALKSRWLAFPQRVAVHGAAVGRDGSLLAWSSKHPGILRKPGEPATSLDDLGALYSAVFVDPSRVAVAPVSSNDVLVYDVSERRITVRLRGHDSRPRSLLLLEDGRLASGSAGGDVRIWNIDSGRCELVLRGHEDAVGELVALPGSRLATADGRGKVRIWNLGPRPGAAGDAGDAVVVTASRLLTDLEDYVAGLAATADGALLAAGGKKGQIRICEPDSGREVARIEAGQVTGLAFTPDGRRLLQVDSRSSALQVYDTATWERVVALREHADDLTSVRVAPDGTVVTTDVGGLVKLWPVE